MNNTETSILSFNLNHACHILKEIVRPEGILDEKCHLFTSLIHMTCPVPVFSIDCLQTGYSNNRTQQLDNIFITKSLEEQSTKNNAINKDVDEWIDRTESMA